MSSHRKLNFDFCFFSTKIVVKIPKIFQLDLSTGYSHICAEDVYTCPIRLSTDLDIEISWEPI